MLLVYHFCLKRKIWMHKFPLLDSHRSFCNLALASETGCSCCRPQPSVIESNAVSAKTLGLLCVVVAFPMFSCQGLWVRGDRVVIWRGEGSEWKIRWTVITSGTFMCIKQGLLPEHGSPSSAPPRLVHWFQGPAGTYNP